MRAASLFALSALALLLAAPAAAQKAERPPSCGEVWGARDQRADGGWTPVAAVMETHYLAPFCEVIILYVMPRDGSPSHDNVLHMARLVQAGRIRSQDAAPFGWQWWVDGRKCAALAGRLLALNAVQAPPIELFGVTPMLGGRRMPQIDGSYYRLWTADQEFTAPELSQLHAWWRPTREALAPCLSDRPPVLF